MLKTSILSLALCLGGISAVLAEDSPLWITNNLYDAANQNDLGLKRPEGLQTITVFAPSDDTDHFSNGICMVGFKGGLYCMWQSSKTDEDSSDTWVAYARSMDGGSTWSQPMVLAPTIADGSTSSGGWWTYGDELIAYINTWNSGHTEGYTRYITSTDGLTWSEPAEVTMADGSRLDAIFEQDPHALPSGRIVNAAHFAPGLFVYPIYTDDPSGKTGWHKASFTPKQQSSTQSRELEPSLYRKPDGTLVMIFRDQSSTFYKLASVSTDNGESWSSSVLTNFPDSRSKQSAGNLPDGTAFVASNPVSNKNRWPLALTLSADGSEFNTAWLLRSKDEMQPLRYSGSAKREYYSYPKSVVIDDWLYVAYSTNKEDVEYSRVPLSSIQLIGTGIEETPAEDHTEVLTDLMGRRVSQPVRGQFYLQGGRKILYQ